MLHSMTIRLIHVDQLETLYLCYGVNCQYNIRPHKTSRNDNTSLAPSLQLAVGARTMLIANVDVSDGLCNGVSGIIEDGGKLRKKHAKTRI